MKLLKNKIRITCDGGAATGKSTGAKLIAQKYNIAFLSSGLLYRYASYLLIKNRPKKKIVFLKKKFKNLNYNKIKKINLHTVEISKNASIIAKLKSIRTILKDYQIKFIKKNQSCVLEGRDASTKILPNSDVKFFFVCNLNTAAKRRMKELKKRKNDVTFLEVKNALKERNKLDRTRKISPLQKHPDAVVVNTSKLDIKSMVEKMSKNIEKKIKNKL